MYFLNSPVLSSFLLSLATMLAGTKFFKMMPVKELRNVQEFELQDHDPYFVDTKFIYSTIGPESITRNILEDKNGNIWLATWEGLIQYKDSAGSSTSFINFTNKEGLRRYRVFTLMEDTGGNIWIGTVGAGIYFLEVQTGTFTNYTTKHGLINDRIGCIYQDKTGNIWIGTQGGISIYKPGSDEFTKITLGTKPDDNDVNSIIEDQQGNLWIGTRGQTWIYSANQLSPVFYDEDNYFQNVRCIIMDYSGHIWLGGSDGLWRYDGDSFTNHRTHFTGYIFEDRLGNIWTSSESPYDGNAWVLSVFDIAELRQGRYEPNVILKQEGMLFGIHEDKGGHIWFGTLNGVGRFDGFAFQFFK